MLIFRSSKKENPKTFWTKILSLIVSFTFISAGTHAVEVKVDGNILQSWIQLSLIGKEQSEIELFFKEVDPAELDKVKKRLREYVLNRLRSKQIKKLLRKATEVNDISVIIDSILEETRYYGLENDEILKYNIKEEFEINPFWWKKIEAI